MNVGANYLREHVIEKARLHYVITDGGGEPNVVPPTRKYGTTSVPRNAPG